VVLGGLCDLDHPDAVVHQSDQPAAHAGGPGQVHGDAWRRRRLLTSSRRMGAGSAAC
jgi:hypothetical protein